MMRDSGAQNIAGNFLALSKIMKNSSTEIGARKNCTPCKENGRGGKTGPQHFAHVL
jgi:hypothetical protein